MSANCANCQAPVNGNFCSDCGQSTKSRRGPIWQVLGEFLEEFFAFDAKVYSSIFALFFKPGHLSLLFVQGKRVAILPPVRMYLVVSLLFFVIFQIDPPDVSERNVYIGGMLIGKETPNPEHGNLNVFDETTAPWIAEMLQERREEIQTGNAQLIINKLFNVLDKTLPNMLVIFLPLLAVLMKILFLFKRVLYIDHLIFSLHFQIWLMAWVMIIYGLSLYNPVWSTLSIVVPIYLAIAQKKFYQQSYWLVIPKTFAIITVYTIVLAALGLMSLLFAVAFI